MDDEYMTVDGVADLIKCSKLTIYGMVAKKKIPYKKPSRRLLRFKKSEILAWIDGEYTGTETTPTSSVKKAVRRKAISAGHVNGIVCMARKEVLGT
jgi:excisionase family DNA binding protein